MVALTLLRIFPRIDFIESSDEGWKKVIDTIYDSKLLVDHSSKKSSFIPPRGKFDNPSPRSHVRERCVIKEYSQVPDRSDFALTFISFRTLPVSHTLHLTRATPIYNKTRPFACRTVEYQTSGGKR